jgi:predicted transcriptional regulator
MSDTTIKVPSEVRDRLAELAAERGTTIRDLVTRLAQETSTEQERRQRQDAAVQYVRDHLRPDFSTADVEAGEQIWRDLESDASSDANSSAA